MCETESVRLEPGVDDRAYCIQGINLHRLRERPVWNDTDEEETIKQGQQYSEIADIRS